MLPHMWCPGCGNGIALGALARALAELNMPLHQVVVVTGIGCWGKADDYLATNALHATHGRALAFATGVKATRPELSVVVLMGDGDGATIGGNHLIHAARRNVDLTAVVVNNYNYGMTGGQVSATTPPGALSSTTQYGNPEQSFDLCRLVDAAGANYVARGTVYHVPQLDHLIKDGIQNKGFSFIEVYSTCPTHYGKRNGFESPVEMMRQLKAQVGRKNRAVDQGAVVSGDLLHRGKFVERNAPDFTTRYEQVKKMALTKGGR